MSAPTNTAADFKRYVSSLGGLKATTKTVGFQDLARTDALCATVKGRNVTAEEWAAIESYARECGIRSVRHGGAL